MKLGGGQGDLSDRIKTHTREQIFCFGPDGLLRRQDYTVDILGGDRIELCIRLSRSRRDHHPDHSAGLRLAGRLPARPGPAAVAIDMGEITMH